MKDRKVQGYTHDIINRGICAGAKGQETDSDAEDIESAQRDIFSVPRAFSQKIEPEEGREVESESGDEERRADGQEIREEGDDFCDDEGNDRDGANDHDPGRPSHR